MVFYGVLKFTDLLILKLLILQKNLTEISLERYEQYISERSNMGSIFLNDQIWAVIFEIL